MANRRKVIRIDEEKCNGCGECIPNCPEGALQIIDGKARLVSDLFCDGLGACVGHCPVGAMRIEEREAEPYDEKKVMENIVKAGPNTIRAHLKHLEEHGAVEYLRQAQEFLAARGIRVEAAAEAGKPCGCPGARMMDLGRGGEEAPAEAGTAAPRLSRLRNWPVQIALVPVRAPYLRGADLVVAADCAPFAYPDFHEDFLRGKVLLIGCPKLDDVNMYVEKLAAIFAENGIRSVTVVHMEVPCCFGLIQVVQAAIERSGKDVPFEDVTLGIRGGRLVGA